MPVPTAEKNAWLERIVRIGMIVVSQPRRLILRRIFKNSIFVYESELYMASLFPKKILDLTIEFFQPKTVLDVGCGVGKSLDYFFSKGIDVFGVDGSEVALSRANHPELTMRYNLEHELDLNRKFDLIWSFEFVEHIHPAYAANLLRTFSNHSDRIVISAARPGQGGDGHFNERLPGYWIDLFLQKGYKLQEELTGKIHALDERFAKNMLVFVR